ncbi:pseudaminic acid cytidylyltransferase [Changchengzhania lutea]|uniref:pseudaminic acid cytidylyltransferase n=1 Tax=Changchengzhania lutea TaxID=2049305 RepID=UPI00115E8EDB|nr:pseudaminic acid cytidylyltransferase [Changchengzhania lutea]
MKRVCIIPARGGSKRIPKKNSKDFLGKPIITYSIQTALDSNLFDEVMVSTDDKEIANIALNHGAKVPFMRSEKNSNDFATTFEVIEEVIGDYEKLGMSFDEGCCFYATSPLTTVEKLKEANKLLNAKKFATVFPVIRYGTAIQKALIMDKNQRMTLLQPEHELTRSQDMETAYHDAGQFYFFKTNELFQHRKLWTTNSGIIEISESEGQDIDNEIDWQLAELKYQLKFIK